jgi:flavin-dependent dehydrogenase
MTTWDVIVVGAGPAGSIAGHAVARAGGHVLLADGNNAQVHKIGESLPGAAVRILRVFELPLPREGGAHMPIRGNMSSWNSDELVATDFIRDPDGPGWRLDRRSFDADLRAASLRAGASFHASHLVAIARSAGYWMLQFQDGRAEKARWLIDATGRRASVARKVGGKRLRDARLIALYAKGNQVRPRSLDRTYVEAVPEGWWYAAQLPSGTVLACLHVRPEEANRIARNSKAWLAAWAKTSHLSSMLLAEFDPAFHAVDACGARLDRFVGDGWIACGDAALSFDPISSQGILSALHGGMAAGKAVLAALDGNSNLCDAYITQLATIRSIYIARLRSVYAEERRWRDMPFWSSRVALDQSPNERRR